jgi:hypothetical protein
MKNIFMLKFIRAGLLALLMSSIFFGAVSKADSKKGRINNYAQRT